MPDSNTFADFMQRIRAGDSQAAGELVHLYEPEIRRMVRLRLRDPRLRRNFDSMDVCQSVLASFFVRASLGQYELDRPEQLLKLLVTMARNKLIYQVRKQQSQNRDYRRRDSAGQEKIQLLANGPTPSVIVAGEELLNEFRKRMTEEERQVAELRTQGQEWADVASSLGGTPDGRRKQLARAVERISQELGLDEVGDE